MLAAVSVEIEIHCLENTRPDHSALYTDMKEYQKHPKVLIQTPTQHQHQKSSQLFEWFLNFE